ncbi:MAG: hypothetical protein ACREMZ_16780 [Gemmatimonadales bacterium]
MALSVMVAGLLLPYQHEEFLDIVTERSYIDLDLLTVGSYWPYLWPATAIVCVAGVLLSALAGGGVRAIGAGLVAIIGVLMLAAWLRVAAAVGLLEHGGFGTGTWLWIGGAVGIAAVGGGVRPRPPPARRTPRRWVWAVTALGVALIAIGSVLPSDSFGNRALWGAEPELAFSLGVRVNAAIVVGTLVIAAIAGLRSGGRSAGGFSRGVLLGIGLQEALTGAGWLGWLLAGSSASPRAGLFLMLAGGLVLAGTALVAAQRGPRRAGNLGGARVVVTPRGGLID